MNVFVLCTGRCGSTTFARACRHVENYSAAHESRAHLLGPERFDYPASHIEVDNRLAWFLGRLDEAFGEEAFYVHLTRGREGVARSYLERLDGSTGGIMNAFDNGIRLPESRGKGAVERHRNHDERFKVGLAYCDTVNSNIELFLKDKPHRARVQLSNIEEHFRSFWQQIGAEGNLSAALSEWEVRHNARTPAEGPPQYLQDRSFSQKLLHKCRRLLEKFPQFVRDA